MAQDKVWIVQKCIDADKNEYQDWPGYCEVPMTQKKLQYALKECASKWPAEEFRGHVIARPDRPDKPDGSDKLDKKDIVE